MMRMTVAVIPGDDGDNADDTVRTNNKKNCYCCSYIDDSNSCDSGRGYKTDRKREDEAEEEEEEN